MSQEERYGHERETRMTDAYTKALLTIIAVCLVYLTGKDIVSDYQPKSPVRVNLAEIGGRYIPYGDPLPVAAK